MDYRLSAVGGGLETPCVVLIHGDEIDAIRAAHHMLDEHPYCDEVEIFAGHRFVRDIRRPQRRLVA
jgi:hypothetical protein